MEESFTTRNKEARSEMHFASVPSIDAKNRVEGGRDEETSCVQRPPNAPSRGILI